MYALEAAMLRMAELLVCASCSAAVSLVPSKHIHVYCFCTHDASTLIVYRNVA